MMQNSDLVRRIQGSLREEGLPAWLFYGFHHIDPIAVRILGFDSSYHATRRWYYLVPAEGAPLKLVHRIEAGMLDHLPGNKDVYLRWQELQQKLGGLLRGTPRVAMQCSGIPYISRVDGGTIDSIRSHGTEVVSSENLVQIFEAVWSQDQLASHRSSAEMLTTAVQDAYRWVAEQIRAGLQVSECAVQDFLMTRFRERGYVTDNPPIVGVDGHAGNPHYSPKPGSAGEIREDCFLLIDLWAKQDRPGSVFADITWAGYFGSKAPERILEVFDVVKRARDAGFELLQERFDAGEGVEGWEVDDRVRNLVRRAGYGDDFVHRTGHNLGEETHGNGVNFDNLETHDTRRVIPGIGCTIEPGVYLKDFGVRSEINVYMAADGPEITTPPQRELLVLPV